jgi:glycosyltransferase involved in cell wall biosynthesis
LEDAFHRRERILRSRLSRRHKRFERKTDNLRRDLQRAIETGDRPDWRQALPELHDYEFALGPELDSIQPNVIHAQDVHLLGVAARAASRALFSGKDVKLIYDAHEYIQGLAHPRPAKAWSDLEAEYIGRADAVITVAPAIADMLQRDFRLAVKPTVVMNIPVAGDRAPHPLREVVGVPEDETLAVYSGGLDATRGVHTLVEALRFLPDLHLALVSKAETSYTQELARLARQGGFGERLHFSPFVEPQQVVDYLSSADVGVHTIVSGPINHELTLPNKIFEYMHARLPIVISDCRAMSELVEELGIGMRFRSEDVHSLVETLSYVIEHRADYRKTYEEHPDILDTYSWGTERKNLFAVYRDLLGYDEIETNLEHEVLAPLQDVG